jgi:hypothetical protein
MLKKYRLYRLYKSLIKKHEAEFLEKFNVKIDRVGRLYTVINMPPQLDTFGPKDGPRITKTLLQNWLNKLDNFLIEIGVKELTKVQELTELDESNYLLIIRFNYLNVANIATIAMIGGVILASISILSTIIIFLIKLIL